MAWKLPRRGGGFDTSGFDTSGDETWQLARNVQPTDKGVYQQNWAGFTGLTPGGEDVNKYRQDWQDFSKSAEGYDLGTKKHLFMENYLGNVKPTLEDLKNRYPGAAELGMTPEDVYEQEELYKDAPKGYGWFNQGGIASLENRPGYKWGGSPTGKGGWSQKRVTNIPGTDKNIVRHLEKKKWGNFFDKPRHEKFARSFVPQDAGPFKSGAYEFYQSPLGTRAGMRVEPEWYHQRGHKIPENWKESYTPTIDQVSHLYEDEYEEGFPRDPNKPYIPSVLNPWGYQEGGQVNRPGYAPGGIGDLDLRGGGASFGPGTGTSDDIPAMLSDGEFVVTANAVRNLGGGDRMERARRMYYMINQLDPQSQSPAEMSGAGYA